VADALPRSAGAPAPGGLVVGLGHPDRGDDAVGPLVVEAVRAMDPAGVRLAVLADPLRLIEVWEDAVPVILVDAAVGGPPGRVLVHDLNTTPLPDSGAAVTSSHGVSLASVLELSRHLGALPPYLVLVTVAGVSYELGAAPQQEVLDAVPRAAAQVVRLLGVRRAATG